MLAPILLLCSAAAAASPRLLVVDLEVRGADPALQQGTTRLVTAALQESGRFQVLAGDDVRRALTLEATKEASGCSDATCLDEIAGALGAELVVFGDLTKLGDDTLLTLNLFDAHAVRSISRHTASIAGEHLDGVVAGLVHDIAHDYDASRGAFPIGGVAIGAGSLVAVAGVVTAVAGAWQLSLLGDDQTHHDRLLSEYKKSPSLALVDEARGVQHDADGHFTLGAALLGIGIPVVAAGAAAAVWGAVE